MGLQCIRTYIRWLQDGYKIGRERNIIIKRANKKYAESWSAEKIFWEKDTTVTKEYA